MYIWHSTRPSNQNKKSDFQIYDLLQISRHEHDLRKKCLQALRNHTAWKKSGRTLFTVEPLEGLKLRKNARQALLRYKQVRDCRMAVFKSYMQTLPHYGGFQENAA